MMHEPAIELPDETEYRAYFFINTYLIGIHAGIQAAHAAVEMTLGYNYLYDQWASDHKTIIVLNGGTHSNLEQIYADLVYSAAHVEYINKYDSGMYMPVSLFKESMDCLNGANTAVGIVVPDRLYMAGKNGWCGIDDSYTLDELAIIAHLQRYPLAR